MSANMYVDYLHEDSAKDEQSQRSRGRALRLGIYFFVSLVALAGLAAALYKQRQDSAAATLRLTRHYDQELTRANQETLRLQQSLSEQRQLVTAQAEKLRLLQAELERAVLVQRAREAMARASLLLDRTDPEATRRTAKQREKRRTASHCPENEPLCDL